MSKSKIVFLREEKQDIKSLLKEKNNSLYHDLIENEICDGKKINFVGVYYSKKTNTTVYCYPKYMSELGNDEYFFVDAPLPNKVKVYIKHLEMVLKVIERYSKSSIESNKAFDPLNKNKKAEINQFSVAKYLLQDYLENDIYEMNNTIFKKNAKGKTNWSKTVNQIIPFVSGDEAYYLETINKVDLVDYDRIITQIHKLAICECAMIAKDLLGISHIKLPEMPRGYDNDYARKKISVIIGSYLNRVFSQREINLLKALISWFGNSENYKTYFGSTTYNLVWEKACQVVFGHDEDEIKTNMSIPLLFLKGNIMPFIEKTTTNLLPDILRRSGKHLFILDAKYYHPKINMDYRTYVEAPSASDISKQFSYELQLKNLKDIEKKSVFDRTINAFLFPHFYGDMPKDIYENIGYTIMDHRVEALRGIEERISYIQINPEKLYIHFLNNQVLSDNEMKDLFAITEL